MTGRRRGPELWPRRTWATVGRGRLGRARLVAPRLSVLVAGTGAEVERCVAAVVVAPELLAVGSADPWTAAARVVRLRPDVCVCCGPDPALADRVRDEVGAMASAALPTTRFVRWSDVAAPARDRLPR